MTFYTEIYGVRTLTKNIDGGILMKITVYAVVFRATGKLRNGEDFRFREKTVFMLPFDKETGKHLTREMQIKKGIEVLKAEGYWDIEYLVTRTREKLFAE